VIDQILSYNQQATIETLRMIAFDLLAAFGLALVGFTAIRFFNKMLTTVLIDRNRIEPTLGRFIIHLVKYTLLLLVLIAIMDQFGIKTTSILTLLGAAGLAIGLALQGTLSNIAAGVFLIILRPIRVGELVLVEGYEGTVREIGLFMSMIEGYDGIYYYLPNSLIAQAPITNLTRNRLRRASVPIFVGLKTDLEMLKSALFNAVKEEKLFLKNPAPAFHVGSYSSYAINVEIRAWTRVDDVFTGRAILNRIVSDVLRHEQIPLPPAIVAPAIAPATA